MHVTLKSFFSQQLNEIISVKVDYKTTHPCAQCCLMEGIRDELMTRITSQDFMFNPDMIPKNLELGIPFFIT